MAMGTCAHSNSDGTMRQSPAWNILRAWLVHLVGLCLGCVEGKVDTITVGAWIEFLVLWSQIPAIAIVSTYPTSTSRLQSAAVSSASKQ